MFALKRGPAVLLVVLLTFVCQFSAAHEGPCGTRLQKGNDPFRAKLQVYDRSTWLRNIEVNCNSTNVVPRSVHADLIPAMPEELKEELRLEIAGRRARRWGNKRNLDFVFNLLDRGDKLFATANSSEGEAAYHRYFEHESAYFSPGYGADLVLEVAHAIQAALPQGSSVGFGGSFVNARADMRREAWDVDLMGRNISEEGLRLVTAAIENVFKAHGLKIPKVDHHRLPPFELGQLSMVYFEIQGGSPILMWVNPPFSTDRDGYLEPTDLAHKFEIKP